MKNVIHSYDTFKDNILNVYPIFIEHVFFAGIKFFQAEDSNGTTFVNFQAVTDSGNSLTYMMEVKYDDEEEFELAKLTYSDMDVVGSAAFLGIPNLLNLSCFYKEKIDKVEYFTSYCETVLSDEKTVYKIELNKESFLTVMYILDCVGKGCSFNGYNDAMFIATIINDKTEIIKIATCNVSDIESVYVDNIPYKGYRSYKHITASVVIKDKSNRDIRLFYNDVITKKEYKVIKNRNNVFTNLAAYTNYNIDNLKELPEYHTVIEIPAIFSITANTPMQNYTLICNGNCKQYSLLDMNGEVYSRIKNKIRDFVEKK